MADYGFDPIVGQEQIKRNLRQAAAGERPGHAYILEGEEGSGRRLLAEAFAMTLLCERPRQRSEREMDPCGCCPACVKLLSSNHPDVHYVTHEKTVIGVNDVREQLVSDTVIRPFEGKYKIYIVPEAEKMNVQAQNALLKTLEEPPAYVVLLLLTTSAELLLPTIRSRCMILSCRPLTEEQICQELKKRAEGVDGERAREIAAFARGSLGRALSLAHSERFAEQRKQALRLLLEMEQLTTGELMACWKDWSEEELGQFLEWMQLWFRDVLVCKAAGEAGRDRLVFCGERRQLAQVAGEYSYAGLEHVLQEMARIRGRLSLHVNRDYALEALFLEIKECLRRGKEARSWCEEGRSR